MVPSDESRALAFEVAITAGHEGAAAATFRESAGVLRVEMGAEVLKIEAESVRAFTRALSLAAEHAEVIDVRRTEVDLRDAYLARLAARRER